MRALKSSLRSEEVGWLPSASHSFNFNQLARPMLQYSPSKRKYLRLRLTAASEGTDG